MTEDLQLGIEILGVPTVRDEDGLALSSRNAYLSPEERSNAVELPRALNAAAEAISSGARVSEALAAAKERLTRAGFSRIDYVALVNALTLEPLERAGGPMRLIAAALIGRTRLIDNIAVGL
jgi:pantoate--beta-alanine ligase